jgi:putative transposase
MKRSRFTQEQIIGVLKEHQAGAAAADLCRKHGISDATFYKQRRACKLVGIEPKTCRYVSRRLDDGAVRTRLRALASERRRFGDLACTSCWRGTV